MSNDDIGHLAHTAKQVTGAEPNMPEDYEDGTWMPTILFSGKPNVLDNYEEGWFLGPDGAPIAYYVQTPRILNITYETDAAKDYIMGLLKNEKPKSRREEVDAAMEMLARRLYEEIDRLNPALKEPPAWSDMDETGRQFYRECVLSLIELRPQLELLLSQP